MKLNATDIIKQILIGARDILVKRGWTQADYARDEWGLPVHWDSENAKSFGLDAAILRSGMEMEVDRSLVYEALYKVTKCIDIPDGHESKIGWVSWFSNAEGRTLEEVLELIDNTLSTMEGRDGN